MEIFRKQLELINIKKKIANSPKKRERIINLLGKEDGWLDLSKEWMEDYDVVSGLKNMPISELSFLSKDFMNMRRKLYEETKQRMIKAKEGGPAIILNSPLGAIGMRFKPSTPLMIVTTRQHRYTEYVVEPARFGLQSPLINHDPGSPIYIFGEFIMFGCTAELTECYLLNNPSLEGLWLSGNRLTTIPISGINPKLKIVMIADNPLNQECIPQFIYRLPYIDRIEKPNELHIIGGIPSNWNTLVENQGWHLMR